MLLWQIKQQLSSTFRRPILDLVLFGEVPQEVYQAISLLSQ